jgi:hypothetical protein
MIIDSVLKHNADPPPPFGANLRIAFNLHFGLDDHLERLPKVSSDWRHF